MLTALVKNRLSEKESSTSHADQEHERDIVRGKGWIIQAARITHRYPPPTTA